MVFTPCAVGDHHNKLATNILHDQTGLVKSFFSLTNALLLYSFNYVIWYKQARENCSKANKTAQALVQSLNSFFFPPLIGAQPGRAKEESRITCMRMLRMTPFPPPPNRGKNHIWKCFADLACGVIFWMTTYEQQFLRSDWLKTCQLIPDQWNFTSATLTHIRFVFLSQYQR